LIFEGLIFSSPPSGGIIFRENFGQQTKFSEVTTIDFNIPWSKGFIKQ